MAHKHSVYDTDAHFKIDGKTRVITDVSGETPLIMQYDHNSERLTFELPRFIDAHDLLECNVVQIHYLNVEYNKVHTEHGLYEPDDFQVSPDDENVLICSWLISQNATRYSGTLNFSLRFMCTTDGTVDYAWSTAIYPGIPVSAGIYNGDVVVEEYSDVLEQWRSELENNSVDPEQIDRAVENYMKENPPGDFSKAIISEVTLSASAWTGNNSLYSQVVSIEGVTEKSQVDLTPSVEQLVVFYEKDLTFVTENENGVVTVYAIGQKPTNDYTIQVTITEVVV